MITRVCRRAVRLSTLLLGAVVAFGAVHQPAWAQDTKAQTPSTEGESLAAIEQLLAQSLQLAESDPDASWRLLVEAERRVLELDPKGLTAARIQHEIGDRYFLGRRYDQAIAAYVLALGKYDARVAKSDDRRLRLIVSYGEALVIEGRFGEAELLLADAVAAAGDGAAAIIRARLLFRLARAKQYQNRTADAGATFLQAVAAYDAAPAADLNLDDRSHYASSLQLGAGQLQRDKQPGAAIAMMERAVALAEDVARETGDRGNAQLAKVALARLLRRLEYFARAKPIIEGVLKEYEETGQRDPERLVEAFTELGYLHRAAEDYGAAIATWLRVLTLLKALDPEPHRLIAGAYGQLEKDYFKADKPLEGVYALIERVKALQRALPPTHIQVRLARNRLMDVADILKKASGRDDLFPNLVRDGVLVDPLDEAGLVALAGDAERFEVETLRLLLRAEFFETARRMNLLIKAAERPGAPADLKARLPVFHVYRAEAAIHLRADADALGSVETALALLREGVPGLTKRDRVTTLARASGIYFGFDRYAEGHALLLPLPGAQELLALGTIDGYLALLRIAVQQYDQAAAMRALTALRGKAREWGPQDPRTSYADLYDVEMATLFRQYERRRDLALGAMTRLNDTGAQTRYLVTLVSASAAFADYLVAEGFYASAATYYSNGLELDRLTYPKATGARRSLLLGYADLLLRQGDQRSAERMAKEALEIALSAEEAAATGRMRDIGLYASVLASQGRLREVAPFLDQLLEAIETEAVDPAEQASVLAYVADFKRRLGELDAALALATRSRTLASELRRAPLVARADFSLATIHVAKGEYERAHESLTRALAHTNDQDVPYGLSALNQYSWLGFIEEQRGRKDAALQAYARTKDIVLVRHNIEQRSSRADDSALRASRYVFEDYVRVAFELAGRPAAE